MVTAYLNHIATAVPAHDVHQDFIAFAPRLLKSRREKVLFTRMAERADIHHRYSVLAPAQTTDKTAGNRLDRTGFYQTDSFPDTARRMALYQHEALPLVSHALAKLPLEGGPPVTHLIVTSCTGFFAPGPDLKIIERYGLSRGVERMIIGFMGCHAALHGLKAARHIVRSAPEARVLMINIELCTLHLQVPKNLGQLLCFLLFGDGCAASIISAQPQGLALESFQAALLPDSADHITWGIGSDGFDMRLSGQVPKIIAAHLPGFLEGCLGTDKGTVPLWAVHPGGRTVLDAVEKSARLTPEQIRPSRRVLASYGNMSSPSVMFVLADLMAQKKTGPGCALAFGPGLSVEAMRFHATGS